MPFKKKPPKIAALSPVPQEATPTSPVPQEATPTSPVPQEATPTSLVCPVHGAQAVKDLSVCPICGEPPME